MDLLACHVIYVDKRARNDRDLAADVPASSQPPSLVFRNSSMTEFNNADLRANLRSLLSVFPEAYVCSSGPTCIAKLRELDESMGTDCKPTVVIVDTYPNFDLQGPRPYDASTSFSTSLPMLHQQQNLVSPPDRDDFCSLALIQHIAAEISFANLSKLIIPIAMIHSRESHLPAGQSQLLRRLQSAESANVAVEGTDADWSGQKATDLSAHAYQSRVLQSLDAGALDVVISPLQRNRVNALIAHVYRAHKEGVRDQEAFLATKRLRKRSWVGVDEEKPYAYLRESMVSNLMTSICKPESVLQSHDLRNLYDITPQQEVLVAQAIGKWTFSAHDLSDDELVHAAFLMLHHALKMPQLERWRIPADDLKNFLMACRAAYNGFVLYHNFRHVVDVLQAVFHFLIRLGTLPPYPAPATVKKREESLTPIAQLLEPVDALTLLVAAIGHDVGHPGVNNAFLVALKAPLAQLYNDNSVLEAFHCAAYSQILRRYWNKVFIDTKLRRLLIKSILATDMGIHFKYMSDARNLQDKLHYNGIEGWNVQTLEECKVLICGLLIKCADISNVARSFDIAVKWSNVLQLEFARQGEMEKDVGIPTTLFGGPPEIGNLIKLANSQIGFMNIFARPLFESVADILPDMQFAVREIDLNQMIWKQKIEDEKVSEHAMPDDAAYTAEGDQLTRPGKLGPAFSASPDVSRPADPPRSGSEPNLSAAPSLIASLAAPNVGSNRSAVGPTATPPTETRTQSGYLPSTYPSPPRSGSAQEMMSFSRRSSGAFPAANILPHGLSTKRSSNTVPSQLQLGPSPVTNAPAMTCENVRPTRLVSAEPSPFSSKSGVHSEGPINDSSRHDKTGNGSSRGARGSGSYRGDKGSDGEDSGSHSFPHGSPHFSRPLSNRYSAHPSSSHYSAPSSRDRYSTMTSGAHTLSSHAVALSPADTKATSFLTDGSDGGTGNDNEFPVRELVDRERPRSGYAPRNREGESNLASEVKTDVPAINGHNMGEHVIRKKNSRFRFDFWKKKNKGEGSPGSP